MPEISRIAASFRDPGGFLYTRDSILYRQINSTAKSDYDTLIQSDLYAFLVKKKWLVSHNEVSLEHACTPDAYKIIKPSKISFISYPYEWCFSQLKDAALLTLKIQKAALQKNMVLKDATAFNVQFENGRPVFIDTLSFQPYQQGPWVAYKQFCQHFLAPLALKSATDHRLSQLLATNIDGIPLDLASRLLPKKSYFSFSLLAHIHLHARTQAKYANIAADTKENSVSKNQVSTMKKDRLLSLIEQLESAISGLTWKAGETEWGDYYGDTNYRDHSMQHKVELVDEYLSTMARKDLNIIDLGANDGTFSRIAAKYAASIVAQDIDEVAVEKNYLACKKDTDNKITPIVQDLVNPSPALGWDARERMSVFERSKADVVLALALIHHIAISNNVPLESIAKVFSGFGKMLIIEFVPKTDSQVKRLLATREDIFPAYTSAGFEAAFSVYFKIENKTQIKGTERVLYLLRTIF